MKVLKVLWTGDNNIIYMNLPTRHFNQVYTIWKSYTFFITKFKLKTEKNCQSFWITKLTFPINAGLFTLNFIDWNMPVHEILVLIIQTCMTSYLVGPDAYFFGLSHYLHLFYVCVSSEGSVETVPMRRSVWPFVVSIRYKYQNIINAFFIFFSRPEKYF